MTAATVEEVVPIPDSISAPVIGITPAPVPTNLNGVVEAIDRFLAGSPLEGQGAVFVAAADSYGLDPRLMPSVALWESGKCRQSHGSFNCWGYGPGHDFNSYEEAIWQANKTFAGYGVGVPTGLCYWVRGPNAACDYDYVQRVMSTMEGIQ